MDSWPVTSVFLTIFVGLQYDTRGVMGFRKGVADAACGCAIPISGKGFHA